jgi:tetratricopeptide (TPR) repeat protein
LFFEAFREAVARLPDGLIRPGAAADEQELAAAERALGLALPAEYASFLRSFDGADLFHEAIVIAGVGASAPRELVALNEDVDAAELVFAETAAGDRFLFSGAGAVTRARAGSDERVRSGTSFTAWLDAMVARERILYDGDGEFAPDAFEPDGEEVTPRTALRQAERALRHDPGSVEAHCDRGVALRRLGRADEAMASFERAGELDPADPWPWFDLGRAALEIDARRALASFRRAAEREPGRGGAHFLAWAAHAALAAGDQPGARAAREEARQREPALGDQLRRAAAAAAAEGDSQAAEQAERLVAAVEPERARLRLPLAPPDAVDLAPAASAARTPAPRAPAREPAARRPPPARRRRPPRAAPRR